MAEDNTFITSQFCGSGPCLGSHKAAMELSTGVKISSEAGVLFQTSVLTGGIHFPAAVELVVAESSGLAGECPPS